MKRALLSCMVLFAGCEGGARTFEAPLVLGGREIAPEVLNRGEFVYMRQCRGCHGQRGQGDGPYAGSLPVRPTNLTTGEYPRVGATGGDLPSDEQLHGVLREGIEGTPMGAQGLSPQELEEVTAYLKTLAPVWRRQDAQ